MTRTERLARIEHRLREGRAVPSERLARELPAGFEQVVHAPPRNSENPQAVNLNGRW